MLVIVLVLLLLLNCSHGYVRNIVNSNRISSSSSNRIISSSVHGYSINDDSRSMYIIVII
jgi:hypothetical protein